MSEQIKYEAVFGDQNLFIHAPEDAEFAAEERSGVLVFYKHVAAGVSYKYRSPELVGWVEGDNHPLNSFKAMRRIIRTPTWTVADQKAGKLPTTGMIGSLNNGRQIEYLGKSAGGTLHHVRFMDDGECIRIQSIDFLPIEPPEEKAARLREEWCADANKLIAADKDYRSESAIIYDALLSGELKMPEVQK